MGNLELAILIILVANTARDKKDHWISILAIVLLVAGFTVMDMIFPPSEPEPVQCIEVIKKEGT
jgi:hypothetical protein